MSYEVSFTNLSSTDWNRDVWGYPEKDPEGNMGTLPSTTLQSHGGSESMSYTGGAIPVVGAITQDERTFFVCWYERGSGQRIGVKIHIPAQALSFGTAPYWEVMYDKDNPGGKVDRHH